MSFSALLKIGVAITHTTTSATTVCMPLQTTAPQPTDVANEFCLCKKCVPPRSHKYSTVLCPTLQLAWFLHFLRWYVVMTIPRNILNGIATIIIFPICHIPIPIHTWAHNFLKNRLSSRHCLDDVGPPGTIGVVAMSHSNFHTCGFTI